MKKFICFLKLFPLSHFLASLLCDALLFFPLFLELSGFEKSRPDLYILDDKKGLREQKGDEGDRHGGGRCRQQNAR